MEEAIPTLLELNRGRFEIPESIRKKADNCFGIGSLSRYECIDQVGEGTYGYVYKGKDKTNDELVALKRLILHREAYGFPQCAVREIKFLRSLQHKNIVQLKDVVTSKGCEHIELPITARNKNQNNDDQNHDTMSMIEVNDGKDVLRLCGNLYFVFEFVDHDLGGLIDAKYDFSILEIKCIMKQLFEVLDFLNERKIVHRDIKSSNILISNRHQLKLADFGLARSLQAFDGPGELKADLTNNVITIWYRPPELLLGAVRYSSAVDMWSAGCVLAELELGRPLFPGKSEPEQFDLICRAIGSPNEELWPAMISLPAYDAMVKNNVNSQVKYANTLRSTYANRLSEVTLNILDRILVFDPLKRSSAKVALSNKYFLLPPLPPVDPADLEPMNVDGTNFHEYKTKLLRKRKEEESKNQKLTPPMIPHKQPEATGKAAMSTTSAPFLGPPTFHSETINHSHPPQHMPPHGMNNPGYAPYISMPPRGPRGPRPGSMHQGRGRGYMQSHQQMARPMLPPRPDLKPGPFMNRHYVPPPPQQPRFEEGSEALEGPNTKKVEEFKEEQTKFDDAEQNIGQNYRPPVQYNSYINNVPNRNQQEPRGYGSSRHFQQNNSMDTNDYYTGRRERDDRDRGDGVRYWNSDRNISKDGDLRERKRQRDSRDRRDEYR